MAHKIIARLGVALPQKETKLGSKIDCPSAQRAMILSTRHPELLTSPCPSCRMDSPTAFPSSALPGPCCANSASLPCCANSASLSWSGIVMPRATGKSGCPRASAQSFACGPWTIATFRCSACELCGAPCNWLLPEAGTILKPGQTPRPGLQVDASSCIEQTTNCGQLQKHR